MPPPPPPTSMSVTPSSNGEQVGGARQLMPPPNSRPDSQPWGAPANGMFHVPLSERLVKQIVLVYAGIVSLFIGQKMSASA